MTSPQSILLWNKIFERKIQNEILLLADSSKNDHRSTGYNSERETTQTSTISRMEECGIFPQRGATEKQSWVRLSCTHSHKHTNECRSQKHARRNTLFTDTNICGKTRRKSKEMLTIKWHLERKECGNVLIIVEGFEGIDEVLFFKVVVAA